MPPTMRSCSHCPRKFHKTEHLLRHERSHTGEKPYLCLNCGRRYARSDVLLRHVKSFHSQEPWPINGTGSPQTITTNDEDELRRKSTGAVNDSESQDQDLEPERQLPQTVVREHLQLEELQAAVEQPTTWELDALATASMLQARQDQADERNNTTTEMLLDEPFTHTHRSPQLPRPNDLLNMAPQIPSPNGSTDFMQAPFMLMNGIDTTLFEFPTSNLTMLDFMDLPPSEDSPRTSRSSQFSSSDRAKNIPLERFAQVSRLWPGNRTRSAIRAIPNIWAEVAAYKADNICFDSSISDTSPAPKIDKQNESKWGLDEHKRLELIREFAPECSEDGSVNFPPIRLLNLALYIAFRQPHSLLPFIHQPTFSAKLVAKSILFPLCLLGLVLLDTEDVRDFTHHYLPIATTKCCAELASPSFGLGSSMPLVRTLISATLLLMAWSIRSTSGPRHEFLAQMLYNQTLSLAQLSGLFQPQKESLTLQSLLDQVKAQCQSQSQTETVETLWRAWARVESVKRLASALIMTDAWWAYNLGKQPNIQCSVVRFEMPCNDDLFQSSSARSWKRLSDGGANIATISVTIQMRSAPGRWLPSSQDASPVGITGLLNIIWIRILQTRPPDNNGLNYTQDGVFASESSGRTLISALNEIYAQYAPFLKHKNPNCIAMWHFLNLNLVANLGVFELAAGRDGADGAHVALEDIAIWSRTIFARRACLHAAGMYTAMSRRRIKDGTMLHSEISLFVAGLVLGLYVFMMQPGDENDLSTDIPDAEPYELLSDVDWVVIAGHDGLTGSQSGSGQNTLAVQFLRNGGAVSFSGTICEGGYNAAKMILMEFASLLEEVGKWNATGLCHILRIMSESLLGMEERPGG